MWGERREKTAFAGPALAPSWLGHFPRVMGSQSNPHQSRRALDAGATTGPQLQEAMKHISLRELVFDRHVGVEASTTAASASAVGASEASEGSSWHGGNPLGGCMTLRPQDFMSKEEAEAYDSRMRSTRTRTAQHTRILDVHLSHSWLRWGSFKSAEVERCFRNESAVLHKSTVLLGYGLQFVLIVLAASLNVTLDHAREGMAENAKNERVARILFWESDYEEATFLITLAMIDVVLVSAGLAAHLHIHRAGAIQNKSWAAFPVAVFYVLQITQLTLMNVYWHQQRDVFWVVDFFVCAIYVNVLGMFFTG